MRGMIVAISIIAATLISRGADSYLVRGIVRDSITMDPLPYASVVIPGAGGAVADSKGIFEVAVPDDARALQVICMGYQKKTLPLQRNSFNTYVAYMVPESTELDELVVTRREKYSKKNNPAVEFLNRLKNYAPLTDPRRNAYYSYDKYERLVLGLNNVNAGDYTALSRRIPDIASHIDTSEISDKPYLSLLVKEKLSTHHYRRSPESTREVISAMRSAGIDDLVDPEAMRIFLEDVVREIDLYQNDITLFQNRFVSPLSGIAPDFYKFYLTDTVEVGGERCIMLSFYPHNHATFGFMGHIYIPEGDSTYFIKRVEMHIPREINLNFIDNLYINQDYARASDGSRLKMRDDLTAELSLAGSERGMYLSRSTAFTRHNFDTVPDSLVGGGNTAIILPEAERRDSVYWDTARLTAIKPGENRLNQFMSSLRKVPLYYWGEKLFRIIFSGYISTGSPSKFDIGPVNAMLSFNSVEGTRIRMGGMTTANLSPRWFSRFYGAYGFKDHRWKYGFELEYSFVDKKYHSREFPVKALRLNSSYDLERPGQRFNFTTGDNIVLSLRRMSDNRAVYRRHNSLQFIIENSYNLSFALEVANTRVTPSPTLHFSDGYGNHIGHIDENSVKVTLRYAPGEKFFQTRTYRLPVNLDAPAITLSHTYAPRKLWGARYGVNVTELDFAKRWWFSAFGFLDSYLTGAHVWGTTSYLNLLIPNTNLSYIIQPRSFELLNPMEFISDSYVTLDLTYRANGCIFNYIPLLKKLKLREVFAFRSFWGHLSDRNNPDKHAELLQFPAGTGQEKLRHGPYMEASVGLENIFKVLRVDYVWRLNYRNMPYKVDRSGVRIAVVVTF